MSAGAIAYLITNTVNGKRYVGITTKSPAQRWRGHRSHANAESKRQAISRALAKHGADQFLFEVIASARSWDDACLLESLLIAQWNTRDRSFGYNQTTGGEGAPGAKRTEATRLRMRAALVGKPLALEHRQKLSAAKKGLPLSAAALAAIKSRPARSYKPVTEQTKEKIRATLKARNAANRAASGLIQPSPRERAPRTISAEQRAHLSAINMGKRPSEATLEKLRARRHTEETRAKMSASRKGVPHSPAHREALAEANRRRAESART